MELDQNSKNLVAVMMTQALLGVISPNFRRVAIDFSKAAAWRVVFVLGRDDAFLLNMDNLPDSVSAEVVIESGPLELLDQAVWRIIYRRREAVPADWIE